MRGEGNHKIPGSFAPENMEKTGAERVKYSLACQHEDAISIKFVSYAQKCPTVLCTFAVALRKESVDRSQEPSRAAFPPRPVALRKESVDRSYNGPYSGARALVALRKESVDRSPDFTHLPGTLPVALRKESVDRSKRYGSNSEEQYLSLSARRAWIEVAGYSYTKSSANGSLSARRAWIEVPAGVISCKTRPCRSPQGERG